MVRRTVTLPDQLDERVRDAAFDGESFSAAVARLLERGLEGRPVPSYIGMVSGPGDDVSLRVEEVLGEVLDELYNEEMPNPEGNPRHRPPSRGDR